MGAVGRSRRGREARCWANGPSGQPRKGMCGLLDGLHSCGGRNVVVDQVMRFILFCRVHLVLFRDMSARGLRPVVFLLVTLFSDLVIVVLVGRSFMVGVCRGSLALRAGFLWLGL